MTEDRPSNGDHKPSRRNTTINPTTIVYQAMCRALADDRPGDAANAAVALRRLVGTEGLDPPPGMGRYAAVTFAQAVEQHVGRLYLTNRGDAAPVVAACETKGTDSNIAVDLDADRLDALGAELRAERSARRAAVRADVFGGQAVASFGEMQVRPVADPAADAEMHAAARDFQLEDRAAVAEYDDLPDMGPDEPFETDDETITDAAKYAAAESLWEGIREAAGGGPTS